MDHYRIWGKNYGIMRGGENFLKKGVKIGNARGDNIHYITEVIADFAEILKKLSGATLLPNQLKPFPHGLFQTPPLRSH